MTWPTKIEGSSYSLIWERLYDVAARENGTRPPSDVDHAERLDWPQDKPVPRLSNGEVVALIRGWRRAAARSSVRFTLWYELMIAAYGWRAEGDKFIMPPGSPVDVAKRHAREPYPFELLDLVWAWTMRLAGELDAAQTKIGPLFLDFSWSAYEAGAREAWEQMQRERGLQPKPAPEQPEPEPEPSATPSATGSSWLWLLVAAAFLLGRKRTR